MSDNDRIFPGDIWAFSDPGKTKTPTLRLKSPWKLDGGSVEFSSGASGTFTTVDGKTVTVTKGIITSIE